MKPSAALSLTTDALLIGAQAFRIGVELFFHRLWIDSLVPRMLTFEGANVDIVVGLSAPLAAWASTKGSTGLRVALFWTILGLLALANVATRVAHTIVNPGYSRITTSA